MYIIQWCVVKELFECVFVASVHYLELLHISEGHFAWPRSYCSYYCMRRKTEDATFVERFSESAGLMFTCLGKRLGARIKTLLLPHKCQFYFSQSVATVSWWLAVVSFFFTR